MKKQGYLKYRYEKNKTEMSIKKQTKIADK